MVWSPGDQPDEQPGQERQQARVEEHRAIDGELQGDVARIEGDDQLAEPGGEEEARRAAEESEEERLDHRLGDQAQARRAQGQAKGDLAPPGEAPHEQQAAQVGAGNGEDEGDAGEQEGREAQGIRPRRRMDAPERRDPETADLVGGGMRLPEPAA